MRPLLGLVLAAALLLAPGLAAAAPDGWHYVDGELVRDANVRFDNWLTQWEAAHAAPGEGPPAPIDYERAYRELIQQLTKESLVPLGQ